MEKQKVRMPLSRKIAIMVLVFALALSFVLIALSYFHYKDEMFDDYEKFATNIAAVAASQIDPDNIRTWLDTGKPDEEYERTYERLSKVLENAGIEYLYVVKPELTEVYYVLDTDPSEGAKLLGDHETYYAGAFADNAARMVRGEPIEPIISNEEYGWLMSVYYPMRTSEGQPAGYVGVDILMNDVMNDLSSFAWRMAVLMLALTALFVAVMILASTKFIASPIRQLSAAAKKLVEEEEAKEASGTEIFKQLTIRSQDEIGELYDSLSQMEEDINTYIREMLAMASENERISAELGLANRIQTGMIPHIFPPFPGRSEFKIFASMNPAKEVGGDFYDFFLIDDDHLGLVIADVSGKGVPAALFMMASKIILKSTALLGKSAGEVLTQTNQTICSNNQEEMFVTVWFGILEISTGKLTAANAGHEYPAIKHPDGSFELFRDKHGFVIGGMEGLQYKEYELQLEPGAKIFVYTDGVPEATDKKGEMFGTDRMIDALNKNADAAPEKLLKNVRKTVDGFVKDAEQFDDLTMLCMEYLGPQAAEEPAPKKHSAKEKTKKDNEKDNGSTE